MIMIVRIISFPYFTSIKLQKLSAINDFFLMLSTDHILALFLLKPKLCSRLHNYFMLFMRPAILMNEWYYILHTERNAGNNIPSSLLSMERMKKMLSHRNRADTEMNSIIVLSVAELPADTACTLPD